MPVISDITAEILHDLIDAGSEGNWPNMVARIAEIGYKAHEIDQAAEELKAITHRDAPFSSAEIFEDEMFDDAEEDN